MSTTTSRGYEVVLKTYFREHVTRLDRAGESETRETAERSLWLLGNLRGCSVIFVSAANPEAPTESASMVCGDISIWLKAKIHIKKEEEEEERFKWFPPLGRKSSSEELRCFRPVYTDTTTLELKKHS